jgi:alpha-ketoglutarate-dependent taurine dioxygenase
MAIEVRQAAGSFAGEVLGADLGRAEDFERVHQAFLDHGVIVVRGQTLSPEDQLAFSARFGPLMGRRPSMSDKVLMPGHPEIVILSNKKKDGEAIGFADAGRYWHCDLDFEDVPSLGTVLHALEVPPEGGDTLFCDLEAAYAALPDAMKTRLAGLRAAHTFAKHYRTVMARGSQRVPLTEEQIAALNTAYHPVVRTHPETGRKLLYVNPGHTTAIEGMDEADSDALLEELFEHCLQSERIYRHKWRAGDTVIFDNRRLMHNAQPYDMDRYARHLHRTSMHGDRPY